MQYWCFKDGFGYDHLRLCQGDVPQPGPGQVLLRMSAASLNYRDLVVLRGQHGRAVKPPLIPLSDGVGRIAALGPDVEGLHIGQRVAPAFYQHWRAGDPPLNLEAGCLGGPLNGVLASHGVFDAQAVVPVPEHLSDAQAATLPCAGVTAWSALTQPAPLQPGQTVVIQGSGGVALMALQLACALGVQTILTTSSAARARRLRDLGATHVIDRSLIPDWAPAVRELTDGCGADRVLDLGGAETLNASVKAVKTGGSVILIGNVTGNQAPLFLPLVLTRRITLHAVSCGARAQFDALCQSVETHQIAPVLARKFDFDAAPEAFKHLEKGGNFGKISIKCERTP